MALGTAPLGSAAAAFNFVALGDTAYNGERDYPAYETLIDQINARDPAFSIHVGDIWGVGNCSDAHFERIDGFFARYTHPLVYTPGDNEWTDCDIAAMGGFDPNERLDHIRRLWFSEAKSLGAPAMDVVRQADVSAAHARFVENLRFERDAANSAWLADSFRRAIDGDYAAVVVALHAEMFESEGNMFSPFAETIRQAPGRRSLRKTRSPDQRRFSRLRARPPSLRSARRKRHAGECEPLAPGSIRRSGDRSRGGQRRPRRSHRVLLQSASTLASPQDRSAAARAARAGTSIHTQEPDARFMNDVHPIDLTIMLAYLVLITGVGVSLPAASAMRETTSSLGGIIGLSIIGTNVSAQSYVGAAGGAWNVGIAQANFEWIGAIPAMILASLVFIPVYWRAGVYSIPEYMGLRYGQPVRVLTAGIASLFSIFGIAVSMSAISITLETYLGWPMWVGILVTGGVVGTYFRRTRSRAFTGTPGADHVHRRHRHRLARHAGNRWLRRLHGAPRRRSPGSPLGLSAERSSGLPLGRRAPRPRLRSVARLLVRRPGDPAAHSRGTQRVGCEGIDDVRGLRQDARATAHRVSGPARARDDGAYRRSRHGLALGREGDAAARSVGADVHRDHRGAAVFPRLGPEQHRAHDHARHPRRALSAP